MKTAAEKTGIAQVDATGGNDFVPSIILECAICEREYTVERSPPDRPNICSKCYVEEYRNLNSKTMNTIGKNIRTLRQKKGWSQGKAAAALNISVPAFSKIETGLTDINMSRLKQVSELFEVKPLQIICSEEEFSSGSNEGLIIQDLRLQLIDSQNEVVRLQKKVIILYEEARR